MAYIIGIETSISLDDAYLTVYQETIDKTTKLYFMFSEIKQAIVLFYADKCYIYRRRLFTDAFEKAKNEREKSGDLSGRVEANHHVYSNQKNIESVK